MTRIMPCGCLECGQVEFLLVLLAAQGVDAHLRAGGVEDPHHDLLAHRVGRVLTRKSMDLVFDTRILIRPSCGLRRSEISRPAITLRRAEIRLANWIGGQPLREACRRYGSAPGRSSRRLPKCKSEDPPLIASSSILLTKRTTGASSRLRASIFLSGRFDAYIQSFQVHVIETCQAVGCILE